MFNRSVALERALNSEPVPSLSRQGSVQHSSAVACYAQVVRELDHWTEKRLSDSLVMGHISPELLYAAAPSEASPSFLSWHAVDLRVHST